MSEMKWEIGAKMRILDAAKIDCGEELYNGDIYEVVDVDYDGTPAIFTPKYGELDIAEDELPYVERVLTAVDYAEIARRAELGSYGLSDVERNAELGQPSESCECDCVGIAEELADIKAMIGRLVKNGGDEE